MTGRWMIWAATVAVVVAVNADRPYSGIAAGIAAMSVLLWLDENWLYLLGHQ